MATGYGTRLRQWRTVRRMSQLDLATAAEVSTRHVSFLETGRARPSREMVIHLATALDVPLRERNELLAAAGFAAEYTEGALDGPALEQVRHVLELILGAHEPFPAIVVDRGWDVLMLNPAASGFIAALVDPESTALAGGINAVRLVLHPEGVRPHLRNWDEVAAAILTRLQRELASRPTDSKLGHLWDEVIGYPGVSGRWGRPGPAATTDLLVPFHYTLAGDDYRLFSTIATIGAAHDITLEELRLETFFPADAATETRLYKL